ncbi:MAG: MSHA biogenesis protein MshQ [Colwellia sp.]|jgi:MSHA biogenesis protein MshQ
MKQGQIIFYDGLVSNVTVNRWEWLLLVTLLLVSFIGLPAQAASVYKFSPDGLLPIGCSPKLSSTTAYTCGVVTLAVGDTITVGTSTPVTITFTGAFTTAAGNLINTVGATTDLNIVTNGVLTLGANSTLNANVIGTAAINMGVDSTIGGNITASTSTGVVTLGQNSSVGGFIHTDAGPVNVASLSTIGGGITTQAGAITLLTNIKVGGDISTVAGAITIGDGSSTRNSVFSTGAGVVVIATNVQVGENVSTINGAITISGGSKIGGDVSPMGNGAVTLTGVHVGGKVVTSAGAITLTNSRVVGIVEATGAGIVTLTTSVMNDTSLIVPVPSGYPIQLVPLVSDHHFDENSWSGDAKDVFDSSANGHHGKASKSMTNSIDGVVCNAADFSQAGTSNYVSLDALALNGLDDFSISIWGKSDSSRTGAQTIFSAAESASYHNSVLMFFPNTSTLQFYFRNEPFARYNFPEAINDREWHHYVWTRDEGKHCLFMDGVSQGCQTSTYTGSISIASNGLIIGQEQDSVGGGFQASQAWEGLVDEPMIFSGELSAAQILSIYSNQAAGKNYDGTPRICPTIHHYEISHDGQGLTCEAETLIIKACTDESCSSVSTEPVTLDVLADGRIISSPTFTGTTTVSSPVSSTVSFNHTVVETLTFSVANATIAASNATVCNNSGSASCDMAFTNAGFRFLYGNSTTIPNQTSGTTFGDTLELQAVKDIDGVCKGLFSNDKEIDLSQENVDPGGTSGLNFTVNGSPVAKHSTSTVISTTLNFATNSSIATIPAPIYHDAGEIRLHANYDVDGVTLTGSSNLFWVSPAVLVVSTKSGTTHLNAASATETPTHKAGAEFNLTVTALNSLDHITPNYSPGQIQFKLERTGPTLADKNVDGYLTYNATSTSPLATSTSPIFQDVTLTNFSSGVSGYNTAHYSEVGLLKLEVQDSNYGNANIVIPATAINIGRFTPDHFKQTVVRNGGLYATCDTRVSLTAYSGQKDEMTSTIGAISYLNNPILAITAHNKQHGITQNYYEDSQGSVNDFMKLSNTDVVVIAPTLDKNKEGVDTNKLSLTAKIYTGILSQNDLTVLPSVIALPNGVLHYQLSESDNFFYKRSANALVEPFTSAINISTATIKDADDVDLIPAVPIVGSPTTVDALLTGVEIRFGRLRLENSFAPETSNLPQPMQLEHFDGTGFVVSADNNCVSYDASKISLTNISLDPSFTEILGGTGFFFNGKTRVIELEAPGASNQGEIDVSYDTYDWLKYDWDNDGAYDNPSATATFGLFRGNDRIIYQREVYR